MANPAPVLGLAYCSTSQNLLGSIHESLLWCFKSFFNAIRGCLGFVFCNREKCRKEVGRVVGEGENMRRVERSVSGRSESSSGEEEEEVEGG